jgi:monoamine oxidase
MFAPKLPTAEVPLISAAVREAANAFTGKILIIGSGSSGMFAGYTLQFLGVENYEILEAHAYYGGRVQEMNDFCDVPLDLGAEWIHVQPRVLQDLLLVESDKKKVAASIKFIQYQPQTFGMYKNGKQYRRDWLRFMYKECKFLNSTWFAYHRDYVYPYIANKLHLNTVVETIDTASDPSLVKVTTKDGRVFEGNHVIVAMPVSILQEGIIKFVPPMPREKHLGWDSVEMAPGLKLWIEFDEHFYPDFQMRGTVKDFLEDGDGHTAYFDALFRKPCSNRHILCLLHASGRGTAERVAMDDEQLLATVLAELDKMFDGKASAHYVKSRIKNWSADPYIQGVYSWNDYSIERMLKPECNDRVYFCGEYLVRGYEFQGTVHGAAMSGREVAQNVLLDAARKKTSQA